VSNLWKDDGPCHRPLCKACKERFDWYPEVARKNRIMLQKEGLMKDGRVKVHCPKCGVANWLALPGRPGLDAYIR